VVNASLVDIGRQVNRGLAWVGAAQSIVSLLDIVSVLVILRFWVSQEEYGQAMLAYSLFPMLDIIGDLGIGAAIVGREQTREQLSTLFWLNILLIFGVFLVLCGVGPLVALLHGVPVVGWMIIAWGGKLVFQSTYIIPLNLMRRELRFAELSAIRVVANLVEAVAKIGFAWAGFHLWCFVLGGLSRQLVTAAGVRWRNPWRPGLVWRPREAWDSIKFGMRTSTSELLYYLYSSLDVHVVSLFFGKAAAGLYATASQLVLIPVKILSGVVGEVAFPAFARLRHEGGALVDQLVGFTRLNLAIVLPYVALIALVCADFIALVVPGWTAAVPAIRVLCLVGVLRSLSAIGPPLFYGIGKAGLVLRYMVVAAITLPSLFALGAVVLRPLGFISVAIAWVVGYPIAFAVLVVLAVAQLQLSLQNFAARIWGVAACTPLAALPALGVMLLLGNFTPLVRLIATAVVFLTGLALLLAYWQAMGPRAIARSLAKR
jgi:O-antigen/teichoic acid export membrane protein